MNKIFLFCFCIFYNTNIINGQKINYESAFQYAQERAAKENKPVAILLTSPNLTQNTDGLKSKEVIEKLNGSFINYHAVWNDTARAGKIIRAYRITRFPSFVFLDAKGGFLFTDIARLATKQPLLDMMNKALSLSGQTSMVDYDSMYLSGNRSASFLKEYIIKRQAAGLNSNATFIEEYVNSIPVSALNRYEEVLFILKAGPYLDSSAYKLARLHKDIVDSIYKTEPLDKRIAMNDNIIANSMDNAVATKNVRRAIAIADFARHAWGRDVHAGFRAYNLNLLGYYLGTKDTASYLTNAISYYDLFYMRPSIDSLKKKEALRIPGKRISGKETVVHDSAAFAVKTSTTFAVARNNPDALELNNAAWRVYRFSSNETHLTKALLWSRRSIELEPRSPYYDTYAHILYKMGLYTEATAMEKKAIEFAKNEKVPDKNYQETLKKIISKTL